MTRTFPYVLLALLLVALPAFAQEPETVDSVPVPQAEDPAPPADDATQLEEIVVTAERRLESLQDTPISIEAFNADKLEQRGLSGAHDLQAQVPGLTIEPFPTHNATLRIFIRGVGINDSQLTQDPANGVYVDGVYVARSLGLALDVADLDRIEVLRGPQGTLYGRNTTGGAINLITKRPATGVFSMQHSASFSERSGLLGKASFNVPLGDALAVKIAALSNERDGYIENDGPGGDFADREETALRFDARWVPWYWLTADYSWEKTEMRYFNQFFQSISPPTTNKGQAELFKTYAATQTVYAQDRLASLAAGPPFEQSNTDIDGQALTLTVPLFDAYELKYIGSRRELVDATYADLGGGAGSMEYRLDSHVYDGPAADLANGGPTPLVIPTVTQAQRSHELQLGGNLFGDTVEFIVGVFQFEENAIEDRHRLNHQLSTVVPPDQFDELQSFFPETGTVLADLGIVDPNEIDNIRLVNFVDFNYDIENEASAYFGQFTVTPPVLDDRLHLTLGYRHSEDERRAVKFRISDSYLEVRNDGQDRARLLSSGEKFDNVAAASSYSDDSWSWVVAYDFTDHLNAYLKSSEAYKTGGFNVRDPHINAQSGQSTSSTSDDNTFGYGFVDGFAPERVHSYELGLKSEWLGRRLRVNADVFDSDYTDMQINFLIPGTISDTKCANAGQARMRGFELDATFLAMPGLVLLTDYAFLDAEVLDVRDINGNNVAHLFPFTSAPRHSYVLGVDWAFWKTGAGDFRSFVGYTYVGKRQGIVIAEERRDLSSIPAHDLLQARLTFSGFQLWGLGSLDVALWGKNLLDEVYPIIAIDNVPHADRAVIWGEPRSLGLDFIYRYF